MKSRGSEDFQDGELSENTAETPDPPNNRGSLSQFSSSKFSNNFFFSLLHNILGTSKAISKLNFRKNVEQSDAIRTVFDVLNSFIISYRDANST